MKEDLHNIMTEIETAASLSLEIEYHSTGYGRASAVQSVIKYIFTFPDDTTEVKERVTYRNEGNYTLHMSTAHSYFSYFQEDLGKPATLRIIDKVHGKEYDTFY